MLPCLDPALFLEPFYIVPVADIPAVCLVWGLARWIIS